MLSKDQKILVIVESPNKTSSVTHYFNQLGYKNVRAMATVGHITAIKDNKKSYKNSGIYPDQNFKTDTIIDPDPKKHKKQIIEDIKSNIQWCDVVLLCSDGDREGEKISGDLKHFLKIADKKYIRYTFHEITLDGIRKGLENPMKINNNLVDAANARRILDKLFGYGISPVVRKALSCPSAGRVQTPTLMIIVMREREIKSFVPEVYFDLYLHFNKNNNNFKAKYFGTITKENKKISTIEEINKIKNECDGHEYIIESIDQTKKKESPKPPFTTSTFLQEANRQLGFSSDSANSCAQKLFEAGYVNYLRTDDSSMDPEFLKKIQEYITLTFGKEYCGEIQKGKKGKNAQEAHECFRVTNISLTPEKFAEQEDDTGLIKIYKLIWERTIMCTMTPAIINDTQYNITNNKKHKFVMHSREVAFEGYRKAHTNCKSDDELIQDDIVKETFEKGEVLQNTKLQEEKKQTTPPSRYTEATLINALEKLEIGRPSTIPSIIKVLYSESRGYCIKDKEGKFTPTDKGMSLIEYCEKNIKDLINLEYTKKMEDQLDNISNGKINYIEVLKDFYSVLENIIKITAKDLPQSNANIQLAGKSCPKCGKPLVVKVGKYGKFLACSGYRDGCKYTEKILKTVNKTCPECGSPLVERYSPKTKKKFLGCSKYPECKHMENIK